MQTAIGSEILLGLLLFLSKRHGQHYVEIKRLQILFPLFLERMGNEHSWPIAHEMRTGEKDRLIDKIIHLALAEGRVRKRGSNTLLCHTFNMDEVHAMFHCLSSVSELQGLEHAAETFFKEHAFPAAA